MHIDLPTDLLQRVEKLAADGEDVSAVIAKGIERLEWEAREVAAVQEGIDAYERGESEPLEDFDRRFREEHGITPDA